MNRLIADFIEVKVRPEMFIEAKAAEIGGTSIRPESQQNRGIFRPLQGAVKVRGNLFFRRRLNTHGIARGPRNASLRFKSSGIKVNARKPPHGIA